MGTNWYENTVLNPQELYDKCLTYQNKHLETYSIAFDIINYHKIVTTSNYDCAKKVVSIFCAELKKSFPDSLVGKLIDGNYIVITKYSSYEIDDAITKLYYKIKVLYQKGKLPMNIDFHSGIAKNITSCDQNLKNAITAMLYPKNDSVYIQYYRLEMDSEREKEEDFIKQIDSWIENKQIGLKMAEIKKVDTLETVMNEIRLIDIDGNELFERPKKSLIHKYQRDYKIDQYYLTNYFENVKFENQCPIMINFNFTTIFMKQYEFFKEVKEKMARYHLRPNQIFFNIDYHGYHGQLMNLLYETRKIKSEGFGLCIQSLGILEKCNSPAIAASIEVDYIKVGKDTLIKAMNERRLHIILKSFIEMYLELGITPIFTNVDSQYQIDYIRKLNPNCLFRQ